MNNILNSFTSVLSHETGLDKTTATAVVKWMENEGVLDYAMLKETYSDGIKD